MNIKPLFARVLLERHKVEKIGSIQLPESMAKQQARLKCKVLAVGPHADESIKTGSVVLIGRHAGDWLNTEGKPVSNADDAELFIVQDEDILAEVSDG